MTPEAQTCRASSKGGRPRGFDRDAVLWRIAELFDQYGYEGLSVSDLADELGLSHPSLYAAFGPKAVVYRMALEAYAARWTQAAEAALSSADVEAALGLFFQVQVQTFSRETGPGGCMLSAALQTSAADHAVEARHAVALRARMVRTIRARLDRAVRERQLPSSAETATLAISLCGIVHGLSTLARDGVKPSVLAAFAEAGLAGIMALAWKRDGDRKLLESDPRNEVFGGWTAEKSPNSKKALSKTAP